MKNPSSLDQATPLLGGLSPSVFMRRHWHKKPLLIRQALPDANALVSRSELFALAEQEGVESRLIRRKQATWSMRPGPFSRRQLPALNEAAWTLLVQGVDLHVPAAHALMQQFRFIPDARLDDVMVSYASAGGGVGPHVDSYDVFLLQVHGRRRWQIGRLKDPALQPGTPLKILSNFVSEEEWVLEPGDMLYLPPRWAHDGVAMAECMTCSIGFRAAPQDEFAREVLQRSLDAFTDEAEAVGAATFGSLRAAKRYSDANQAATAQPALIPVAMQAFAETAVAKLMADQSSLHCSLGEWLSEPKPQVWFDEGPALLSRCALRLHHRTRMLYDQQHVFINGESFQASGRDARLMHSLADHRLLTEKQAALLSDGAWCLVQDWAQAGWALPMVSAEPV